MWSHIISDDEGFFADTALLHQAAPGDWGATIVKLFLKVLQIAVGACNFHMSESEVSSSCSPPWCPPGRLAASSHSPLRFLRPAVRHPQGALVPCTCAPSPTGPQLVNQDVAHRPPQGGYGPGGGGPQGVGPLRVLGESHVEPAELQKVPGQPAEGRARQQTLQLAAGLLHERQVAV